MKAPANPTPEEIARLHYENEHFQGKRADFSKIALFREIRGDLVEFLHHNAYVVKIGGYAPNPREKCAMQWIDFGRCATMDKEGAAELAKIIRKADGVVLAAVDGHIRISFYTNDVWKD